MIINIVICFYSRRINSNKNNECKEQEQEYIVEKILDKRIRYGIVEYFLKWKDYDDTYNSWEPMENIKCKRLITAFENQTKEFKKTLIKHGRKRAQSNTNVKRSSKSFKKTSLLLKKKVVESDESEDSDLVSNNQSDSVSSEDSDEVVEKDNNLTPINKNDSIDNTEMPKRKIAEKVISVTRSHGKLMILIKIKGIEEPVSLKAKVVHKRCPQVLIKYYETISAWKTKK